MATETDGHLPMDRAHPDALQLGEPVAYRLKMEPHEPARYRAAISTGARLTADGQVGLDLLVFAAYDNDVIPSVYHVVGALPGGAPGEWTRELPVVWAPLLQDPETEAAALDEGTADHPDAVGPMAGADTETPGSVAPSSAPTSEPLALPEIPPVISAADGSPADPIAGASPHDASLIGDGAAATADAPPDGLTPGTPAPGSLPSGAGS